MASINIEIERENHQTKLKYNIPQEVEDLFINMTDNTSESSVWEGLEFYRLPNELRPDDYESNLRNYGLCDVFGGEIIDDNGRFNIAWLRTVGGEGEIDIPNSATLSQVQKWATHTVRFLKDYFENNFRNYKVTAKLEIQM